ncbi:carboxy-S-adenosyl-L-methionine synthase CmoA [Oceanispirochaeta sp.]|uniref:carboxy-S-adenosyl-L-methionine synthase CmoA n=1 Tax=Oceanispirochaeta sp. TaxID=2035350 RepID=UPI0026041E45|nr:carboxy-S-adenosyl-L-methionine synthase CmoA [Oceanispirochaeta sp.]MDA3955600.1 carboxy-S-adenosyl-L-methionine synthase CmoA [Oceanispirochaeta sp.]
MSRKDKVFEDKNPVVRAFEFNESVAHVFDDMAQRSIPHYKDVQSMVATLGLTFYQDGTRIYDLGCSTGTTIALLLKGLKDHGLSDYTIKGIDSSAPMCREAEEKLSTLDIEKGRVLIEEADIMEEPIENASVVIMNYTLQFIDPFQRESLIRKIYTGLNHNGILLVSDKTLQSHTDLSRIFVDNYYNLKRKNGYSELEISRKREALENVLIPYPIREEENLFRICGFEAVDLFYTWYNFSSFICLKKGQ